VRALTAEQRCRGVAINIHGGVYPLAEPLTLDARDNGCADNPILYRAVSGEQAVISGGVKVAGWTLHDPLLGIYKAPVDVQRSRQLYVNGRRAMRAQTSSYPSGFRPDFYYADGIAKPEGIEFIPTELNDARWRDPSSWTNIEDIEAVLVTQWKMMSVPLQAVVPFPAHTTPPEFYPYPLLPAGGQTGLITLQEPAWSNANSFLQSESKQPGFWSFWQVTRFENAYQFLDEPGEWFLDGRDGFVYYIPRADEDIDTAEVYLPVVETLIEGAGDEDEVLSHLSFEGLTFAYATWLGPGSANGYVSDQSGFHLVGPGHEPNIIGHVQNVTRTPGNVRFRYAQNITLLNNRFQHLGAVGLDLDTGSQQITVRGNVFTDISSAAIQLGGVSAIDAHPTMESQFTQDNIIENNRVESVGREFVDAAGIYVGFTRRTLISRNTISDVPWAGIAVGWGWGLLDPGMYPGLPGAERGQWGTYSTPTQNSGNRILNNRIEGFLSQVWDGGAIYTTGQQGASMDDALLIEGNVAHNKRAAAGGNTFYTDGGSRYVILKNNASYENPTGFMNFGPAPRFDDPLPYPIYALLNIFPYGNETGGCRTYGDIAYQENYLADLTFFSVCPFTENGISYPVNLTYKDNHIIKDKSEIPAAILEDAGAELKGVALSGG
ncbi:MAG: right-handed parallel beta-helix repeat-containing protein, partial [Halioglobus sp.]|nr:right-handed parallel beta-helix repeat-containing protein [Halioglobus sp.]